MTNPEFIFFGILVVIILIVSLLLGKALGRSQAVTLEIHKDEEDEQAAKDIKNLENRVLRLKADVRVHLNSSESFSDLLDLGEDDKARNEDDDT